MQVIRRPRVESCDACAGKPRWRLNNHRGLLVDGLIDCSEGMRRRCLALLRVWLACQQSVVSWLVVAGQQLNGGIGALHQPTLRRLCVRYFFPFWLLTVVLCTLCGCGRCRQRVHIRTLKATNTSVELERVQRSAAQFLFCACAFRGVELLWCRGVQVLLKGI